ncbi:Phenol 2-monooxygenase [Escovopsis weberi]|uniref:Phenol 2-monooxygenase n=1 Tax=Escovopsis weberi TaxID=150374 RepID=A0A0M9VU53_ESCWE|nr:Phenol 2-monooxygenase [Escovopsis weberi]
MMKSATEEQVQAVAKKILHPYTIEWDSVTWFSVYTIGQGISERYTLDQRVFLGGDACHTHSPKAGQGMNTAFVDALNLAWKIHAVEGGFANRDILETYESERRSVAEDLIDFDARYAKLFCERPPTGSEVEAALAKKQDQQEDLFIETFKESCEFTTGYGVSYGANIFNWSQDHSAQSPLIQPKGVKLAAGRLFIPSDVTRVADANVVHLEQEIPMNGSFRLFIFAGHLARNRKALEDLAKHLNDKNSFYSAYARPDAEKVSPHEKHNPHSLFFSICTIFAAKRQSIEIVRDVPGVLARYSQHIYADDRWDRKLPNATAAAHAKMGLDEEKGGVVVVRPDGYVSIVTALQEGSGTVDALNDYFSTFCTKQLGTASA